MRIRPKLAVLVWRFADAPGAYQDLSPHGGGEQWVAFIPDMMIGVEYAWMWEGTPFGDQVSIHQVEGGYVRIGAKQPDDESSGDNLTIDDSQRRTYRDEIRTRPDRFKPS